MTPIRVGADIGGTFTDIVLDHPGGMETCKILTDPVQPERAIIEGIRAAAANAGVRPEQITQVIHGTTLVTNAVIERRGARTAFVTTEGFRDVIEMRSENRFEQYDLNLELPKPLIPREHRFTVAERMSADGDPMLPLGESEVERVVDAIGRGGFEAVAIGLLHAYASDSHEVRIAEALGATLPHLSVSLSSRVAPQMRELPRFNTTIVNAYVQPMVADYMNGLIDRLAAMGVDAPVFLLHSGGGLIGTETANQYPVRLLESGPAGGAIFAAGLARRFSIDKALSFDMGGTTAKICLVEGAEPETSDTFEVARTYRFKKGSGMTIMTPVVEMVEIGAGGGSIATVDKMGRVQVGPGSAGSTPGPSCYGRGGREPTVTDANLLLGRLDEDNFAGGAIPLDISLSIDALRSLQGPAGLAREEAAFAISEIVDENMANASRVHAVEKGSDIEDYTIIAFGGGAPLHACRLCEKLGINRFLVPKSAGVGSAIGFLTAPFSYETGRGLYQRLEAFQADRVNRAIVSMESEARAFVATAAEGRSISAELTVQMRYEGQGWEIPVPFEVMEFAADDASLLASAFEREYARLFGRVIEGFSIEILNWSLQVSTSIPRTVQMQLNHEGREFETFRTRKLFETGKGKPVDASEIDRAHLQPGDSISGPAVIVEKDTATVVTSAFRAMVQLDGSILVVRKGQGR